MKVPQSEKSCWLYLAVASQSCVSYYILYLQAVNYIFLYILALMRHIEKGNYDLKLSSSSEPNQVRLQLKISALKRSTEPQRVS